MRYIINRLSDEGWCLDDTQYGVVKASKDDVTVEAESWNKLYFKIHEPKKQKP